MLLSKASIHTLSASKSCFIKKSTQCRVLKGFTTFSLDFSPSPWKTVFPLLKKGKKQKTCFRCGLLGELKTLLWKHWEGV